MNNTSNVPSVGKILGIGIVLLALILIGGLAVFYGLQESFIKQIAEYKNSTSQTPQPQMHVKTFSQEIERAKSLWADGKYNEMLAAAQQAMQYSASDQEEAAAHFWMGVAYYKLGNDAFAEAQEKQAIQLNPKDTAGPYNTLAAVELARNNLQQALQYAHQSIAADPNYAWAHNAAGLALIGLSRKQEGISELKEAIRLDPENGQFRLNLTRAQE